MLGLVPKSHVMVYMSFNLSILYVPLIGHGNHHGKKDGDNMTMATTETDFILLKLVSKDMKMIENTKENISKRIKDESVALSIPFPVHGDEILKDQKNLVFS